MSQEKVDRYKEQKANRKEIIKKEKQEKAVRRGIGILVAAVCVVWLGYSAVDWVNRPDTSQAQINLDAYYDYVNGMGGEG